MRLDKALTRTATKTNQMPNQSTSGTTKVKADSDPIKEEKLGLVREVGSQAVWSLSSCKPGLF